MMTSHIGDSYPTQENFRRFGVSDKQTLSSVLFYDKIIQSPGVCGS